MSILEYIFKLIKIVFNKNINYIYKNLFIVYVIILKNIKIYNN